MPAVQSNRGPLLNAKEYGNLQLAIRAAEAVGGTLVLDDARTYTVTTGITVTSACKIIGNLATINGAASNITPLTITGDDVEITGLSVAAKSNQKAIDATGADRLHIHDCYVTSGWKGITVTNSNDVRVIGNHITTNGDASSGGTGHGVLIAKSGVGSPIGFQVMGNRIVNTNQAYGHGIWWYGGDASSTSTIGISRGVVSGNIVTNVMGGIWGALGQFITVHGNVVEGCSDVGIDFEGCQDCAASVNTVMDVLGGGLATLYNSKRITFTGNNVHSDETAALGGGAFGTTTNYAVLLKHDGSDIEFVGNTFSTVAASSTGEVNAFKSTASVGVNRVVFRANRFYNTRVNFIGGQSAITFENNSFYQDWDINGIILYVYQCGKGVVIRGNNFTSASASAASAESQAVIRVTQNNGTSTPRLSDILIENNRILDWPSSGISVNTYNGTDANTYIVRNNITDKVWYRTASDPASAIRTGNVKPGDNSAVTPTGV